MAKERHSSAPRRRRVTARHSRSTHPASPPGPSSRRPRRTQRGKLLRGLYIIGTDGTVIRGLAVNHFDWAGIDLSSTQHTHIECNYLGLALGGTTDAGNTNNGIHLDSDSGDVIGGSAA